MRIAIALAAACGAALVAVNRVEPTSAPPEQHTPPPLVPLRPRPEPLRPPRRLNRRPPQFVVVSFDGAGGTQLWPYWRSVGRRAHAHFTFFVSGVYLLAEERRNLYRPPRHGRGVSDIWFARPEGRRPALAVVRGMLEQIAAAYREGTRSPLTSTGTSASPTAATWTSGRAATGAASSTGSTGSSSTRARTTLCGRR